ncbi:hypothetical protein JCM9279_001956 [Rhodotorula babjevae]
MLSSRSVALLEVRLVARSASSVTALSTSQPHLHRTRAVEPRPKQPQARPPRRPSAHTPLHDRKPSQVTPQELPRIFHTRTSWITRTLAQGHHIPRHLLLKLLDSRQIPPHTLAVWVDVLSRRDPIYALEQLGLLESATSGMPDIGWGVGGAAGPSSAAQVACPDWLYLSLPGLVAEHAHVPYLASQLLSPHFARLREEHRGLFAARCVQHFLRVRHYVALRETIEWIAYSSPDDEAALTSSRSFERLLAALASERTSPYTLSTTPSHVLRPLVDLLLATMHARNVPRTHRTYLPLFTDKLIPRDSREATRLLIEMAQAGFAPSKDILRNVVGVMQRSGDFTSAAELHEEIRALQRARADARAWVEGARSEDVPLDERGGADAELQRREAELEEDVEGLERPGLGEEEDDEAVLHGELKRVKELRLEGPTRSEAAAVVAKPPPYPLRFLPDDVDEPAPPTVPPVPPPPPPDRPSSTRLEHDPYATMRLVDPAFSRPYFDDLVNYVKSTHRTISFPPPPFRLDGPAWTNLFRMAASQPDIPSDILVAVVGAVESAAASTDLAAATTRSTRAYRPPPPSLRVYTILLHALHRRGDNNAALDLWRSLDARQFQPDGHLLDAVVRLLCGLGRDESALRALEFFGVVKGRDDVVVIPQLTPSRAPRQRTLREGTVPLDVVPFNALLAHHNRAGAHARVHALWTALERRYGVRPDAATLSIVLDAARYAGVAAGRATGWAASGLDDVALGGGLGGSRAAAASGAAVDDRWDGRPAHKVAEEFLWREVLEGNWQDAHVRNPALQRGGASAAAGSASRAGGGLAGWLADKLGGGGDAPSSPLDNDSSTSSPSSRPAPNQDLARPLGWAPFATTLSPTPPRHPHLYPNDRVFRSLIQLVGTHSHLRDIPLLLAWMRRLRVRPSRWTLCLAMAYVDGDAGIRPKQSENWRRWLVGWLGARAVPSEAEIAMPSMYGVGPDFEYAAGNPVTPIGPGVSDISDWWFRGPEYRALKPQDGAVTDLPAGGSIDIEIACHVAWTSYGVTPTDPDSELSACPDNYGAYHAGDPAGPLDDSLVSGCALAIADEDDIESVGWDSLAVFSVNHNCVRQKVTTFDIPERMPSCTGDKCVCAWLWLANNGTANFYMTAFDCRITDVDESLARPILPVIDPVYCDSSNSTCEPAVGAKRPLYAYNEPSNVVWEGNDARPGYHASWSFPHDGAQNDIFDLAAAPSSASSKSSAPAATTTSKRVPHASASAYDVDVGACARRAAHYLEHEQLFRARAHDDDEHPQGRRRELLAFLVVGPGTDFLPFLLLFFISPYDFFVLRRCYEESILVVPQDVDALSRRRKRRDAPELSTSGSSRVVGSVAPILFVLSLALCALL